jgi:ice-binding like protein
MPHSIFKHRSGVKRARARIASAIVLPAALLLTLAFAGNALAATAVPLGDAASFGALDAAAMTNAGGNTVVNGDIGSSTSIAAGVTNGTSGSKYLAGSPELANAQASLLIAYFNAAAATPDQATITGSNLAGRVLTPGVYNSTSSILISGPVALTLDGNGDPNSVFIFQAGSDLTVTATSSVALTNGAQACNVFWQVGSSAFLQNTGRVFSGTILALTQVTLTDSITVNGRVMARNADVTFIHDTVNTPTCATPSSSSSTTFPADAHRGIYCDAAGRSYDLFIGEDLLPPYDTLGLRPGYVDPVTGAVSCQFPLSATTPTPTTPTPTKPGPTAAQIKAAAAARAAATKAAAKRAAVAKAAAAKRLAAVKAKRATIGTSRLAIRKVGFTG